MRHPSRASFILHLLSLIVLLSSCAPVPTTSPGPTVTREAGATETITSVGTQVSVGGINVAPDALRGVNIMIWHPLDGP